MMKELNLQQARSGDFMDVVTYEQFCKHYELNTDDENSMPEYQKYLDHLAFAKSLFNQG
ncbi:MAG: hypothetical protein HRT38_16465 [Alteromonadaceae bacterium]|nr:hypothetical protein [Alteromonadaceae bacterium]